MLTIFNSHTLYVVCMMWSIKVYVTLLETTVVVVSVGGVGWFAEAFSCQNLLPLRLGWAFENKQRISYIKP